MRTVRVAIDGRVQGVAFRAWVERAAKSLGVSGWVRNRRDGSVEAVFSGEDDAVAQMIELCREGPRAAIVSAVRILSEDEAASAPGFTIRPSE